MGKKKQKIKFIDKKNAISFHLVAKADHTEGGSSDEETEQQELDRELRAQRDEERGTKPRGRDGDAEEEEEEVDTRINILNLAAAAEGIDTRAERLKKKALKASSSQKTYLQPDRMPGKNDVQIPKDIPAQYLFLGAEGEIDPKEQAYWDASDARKAELERQSRASALLPHNYDYSKHLKPITGRGTFMEAKRGDEMYDPEMDPRDVVVTKSKAQKAKAKAAASAAAASSSSSSSAAPSSSLSLHEEESKHGDDAEDAEDDDDMPPLGPSGADGAGDGEDEAPVNPELLASVERLQKKLLKQRHRVRVEKDFVTALEGDQTEQFEELQDDFVLQAMAGAIGKEAAGADAGDDGEEAEDDEDYEDGEDDEDYEEEEDGEDFDEEDDEDEDDGEERKSSAKPRSSMNDLYGRRPARRSAADDDAEDEAGAGGTGRTLDDAFDKLLEDEYSDGEIGGLDDTDPAELDGHLEVEEIERELNEFLDAPGKFKSEGGNIVDKVDAELQDLTLRKLALVAAGEKTLAETEQELLDMKERPAREEQWDAESILSTYTNTENHPRVLKDSSSRKSRSKASSAVGSSSGVGPTQIRLARRDVAAFQAPLPIPQSALAHDAEEVDVDEEDEEDDGEGGADANAPAGENKGKARSVLETPEEKKARKQAVKAAQREAKERKKQLKTLYVQETAAAVSKQARLNKANPPGIKKL